MRCRVPVAAWASIAAAFLTTGALSAKAPPLDPTRNAYFGDLHLHTSLSFDAIAFRTNTTPEDSYRFAQGETVEYLGQKVRRRAPLDFLAVTDHSEYLGVARLAAEPGGPFAGSMWSRWMAGTDSDLLAMMRKLGASAFRGGPPVSELHTDEVVTSSWQRIINAAQKYYRPGKFTTFVAYEWSPMPNGAHLHRNVIFRGPQFPARPFSALDSMRPEDLWSYAEHNRALGIDSVLIPHNPNLSDGLMFAAVDSDGRPIGRQYAEARARNERLVEITQTKGTSETRPEFSPADEFANFELMNTPGAEKRSGYVRQAYASGLLIQSRIGVNPFPLGIVGGTDAHSGISTTEESNYPGALGTGDSQVDPHRLFTEKSALMGVPLTVISASGLTGVWAEQNTRESIFDALTRRETFATSGTRVSVRLFGGWKYDAGISRKSDWVSQAYALGVPMGGNLPAPAAGSRHRPPRFLLDATKDPDSANLDRIQIVKVWLESGTAREQVFDVVWSGKRRPDRKNGKLPPIGDTVNRETATYTNDIGATRLTGEWIDPQFDPTSPAVYYARVLEIPTPRWSTQLAAKNGLPTPEGVAPTIQERAWTSPIFYTP
jgi:hypothetical protein